MKPPSLVRAWAYPALSRAIFWLLFAVAMPARPLPAAEPSPSPEAKALVDAQANYLLTVSFSTGGKTPEKHGILFVPNTAGLRLSNKAKHPLLEADVSLKENSLFYVHYTVRAPDGAESASSSIFLPLDKPVQLTEGGLTTITLLIEKAGAHPTLPPAVDSAAKTETAPAKNGDFTPWMPQPELDKFIKGLEATVPAEGPNYWDRGHWISAAEGRWGEKGVPEYRIRYGDVPPNKGWTWYWYLNLRQEDLGSQIDANLKQGLRLAYCNQFTRPDGTVLYQVVWNKYTPE